LTHKEWTAILGWPGYRVYQQELNQEDKTLKLRVRRKPRHQGLECSGCGRRRHAVQDVREREIRDRPWSVYEVTVVVEVHRLPCPECGVKGERIPPVPSKAPFSRRFEESVGQACESAAASQVARRFPLPETTVRAIDWRYLKRWSAQRRQPALKQMGVDEIHLGNKTEFATVVTNLGSGEPLWFGKERKKETLEEYFRTQLSPAQRRRIESACVDMWRPFAVSIGEWAPECRMVCDQFHILQPAHEAVHEVRRAEFFRKGAKSREVVKGKRGLLLRRWIHLSAKKKQLLNELFALNRRVMKAYFLKESLDRLWKYGSEGNLLRYLQSSTGQLRWQRLKPFQDLAQMLLDHLDGILNYCRTPVRFGVVEAINGNIKALVTRGRGYKNLSDLLLKAQRMAVTNTEFVAFKKAA